MRGKRSKQYRKLMEQYSMTFGFREPYQVLVDAEMVQDSCKFKMDLAPALQRTVHGPVKPMITQCEIRKLYGKKSEPGVNEAIELAKTFERRRCGHHPEDYPEPLSTDECLRSVVDPKTTGENKHRYVVASQSLDVRRNLRAVRGVPQIYIKRSVMILEPMADESAQVRAREEKSKFRAELKKNVGKRKRDENDEGDDETADGKTGEGAASDKKKKKKKIGPKGPNPLSVQKTKKKTSDAGRKAKEQPKKESKEEEKAETKEAEVPSEGKAKRKRRKKNKSGTEAVDGDAADAGAGPAAASDED